MELDQRIDGEEKYSYLFVSDFDDEQIWLNVNVRHGHTTIILSKEKAKELILALQNIVDAGEKQ